MGVTLVFGLFGLIIGSFLNVLILRWGMLPLTGRSACPSCGKPIAWYDNVPLISWLMLLGRCRACGRPISIQYPIVEASTGLIFFLIGFSSLPLVMRLLALPIAALLISIAVYDLRHTLIPDAWAYALAAFALISAAAFSCSLFTVDCSLALVAGPIVALPLFAFWFFSRGAWMGFGDVKLALAMGWLLGIADGFIALFLAFMIGGAAGALLLLFSSSALRGVVERITPSALSQRAKLAYTMKSEVPFGPFLVVATFIVWISHMYGFSGFEQILGLT